MLPLKVFNELPANKRKQIARIVFGHMGENFIIQMATPFHHNFDYEDGHWYKLMLSHCSYNKEKNHITVTVHIPV
jgi:lauroyl/myristoyl acyltransferase